MIVVMPSRPDREQLDAFLHRSRVRAVPDPGVRVYRVGGGAPVGRDFAHQGESSSGPGCISIALRHVAPEVVVTSSPKKPSTRYRVDEWVDPPRRGLIAFEAVIAAAAEFGPPGGSGNMAKWADKMHNRYLPLLKEPDSFPAGWARQPIVMDGRADQCFCTRVGSAWVAVAETETTYVAVVDIGTQPTLDLISMQDAEVGSPPT